jgi:hypothetical protein
MGVVLVLLGIAVLLAGCGGAGSTAPANKPRDRELAAQFAAEGWRTDFTRHDVPYAEILSGGPPKDGIPAIDRPRFVSIAEAGSWLEPREPVIALTVGEETRAYPLQILVWHEIVNDDVSGTPVAVTFCPLCNTAIVFDRRVDGRTLDFGTTGKLRNSDLVMYDRQSESWWQQFGGRAIAGRYTGTELGHLPARIVSWSDFEREYPRSRVLSRRTGYDRPYGSNPYQGYDALTSPPSFPAANLDDKRLAPKERVVYVERGREAAAIPFSVLEKRRVVRVVVAGHRLVVRWRPAVASALDSSRIGAGRPVGAAEVRENGKLVPFDEPFWFAVAAFRPAVHVVR